MYRIRTNILIYMAMFTVFVGYPCLSESQKIDASFISFLPTSDEITGYQLAGPYMFKWIVGKEVYQDIVRQKWFAIGEQGADTKKELLIEICIFSSVPEAFSRTFYSSNTYSGPYEWGSEHGSIDGDNSWYSTLGDTPSQYIVRGNIGIRIVQLPIKEGHIPIKSIIDVMLNKIEKNLEPSILFSEQESKKKQITQSKYHQIIDPVLALNETKGFTFFKQFDSKWIIDENSFSTGIRTEYKNEQGAIIGIDVCEFEIESAARSAVELQAQYTESKTFNVMDLSTVNTKNYGWRNYLSLVSVYEKIAVHIYYYYPVQSDVNIFSTIINKLSNQLTF